MYQICDDGKWYENKNKNKNKKWDDPADQIFGEKKKIKIKSMNDSMSRMVKSFNFLFFIFFLAKFEIQTQLREIN